MPIKKRFLFISIVLSLLLCVAQIMGSTILILMCLGLYLLLVGWTCSVNFTLPILLFFLPWSPLLRMSPTSYSFYTFGLVLICFISVIKKRFRFHKYQICVTIGLLCTTLLTRLLYGEGIAFDYIAFIMLLLLFPVVKEEWREKQYDFYQVVTFFSVGVIVAALCALNFAGYANIRSFIRVDEYLTIIRRSGFYGDANFYTAQITAAMGGGLITILQEKKKGRIIWLAAIQLLLIYCGFMSASKSFVLVAAAVLVLWVIEVLRLRGRSGLKFILIVFSVLAAVFIATSTLFSDLIEVVLMRFSFSTDMSSFTTGRTELWENYLDELLNDGLLLLLGKGFIKSNLNGRAAHNTLIQLVYQFGLLGAPMLLSWVFCFFRNPRKKKAPKKRQTVKALILLIGTFVPWLALDMLFFDEFFLLQWYAFIGLQQMYSPEVLAPAPDPAGARLVRKKIFGIPRRRIVWRK